MIEGVVNGDYEAVVALVVRGPSGSTQQIEAVVDTGCNGLLTLPTVPATELELPFISTGWATLADGSEATCNVHEAAVLWDGQPRYVEAAATGNVPLVGMLLLDGHDLSVQVRNGGRVVIRAAE